MTFDPELARQERKQRKSVRDAEIERNAVLRQLMSTVEGRRFAHDKMLYAMQTPFVGGNPDITAFNCGQQNRDLQFMAEVLAAAPEFYLEMMQEQRDGRRTEPSAGPGDEDPDGDYATANKYDPA